MYNIFNLSHQYIIRKKWLPLINCFSTAPSGAFRFLLVAVTSSPQSRKYCSNFFDHWQCKNNESFYFTHRTILSAHNFFDPLFLHSCSTISIAQATMTIVSSTPSSHCLLKIKCGNRSINSIRWAGQGWLNFPV